MDQIINFRPTRLLLISIINLGIFGIGWATYNIPIIAFYARVHGALTDPLIIFPAIFIGLLISRDLIIIPALIVSGFLISIYISYSLASWHSELGYTEYSNIHAVRIYSFFTLGYSIRSIKFLIIKK